MDKELKNIMEKLSIEIYGVCNPSINEEYKLNVQNIINKNFNCSFIKANFLETMNPNIYLNNCKGIIVIGVPYHINNIKLKENQTIFSSSSWGEDYHKVIKNKLNKIIDELEIKFPNEKFISLVDNHTLDERYFAYKSGIGFYDNNGLITNYKYGCNIFLGMILTTYEFKEINNNIKNDKTDIELYIKTCPGKAITNNGINYNKCISYLTQKKELNKEEELLINKLAYGCDICSKVCKYSKIDYGIQDFDFDSNIIFDLDKDFNYTNKEFNIKYGKYSGSWRGKNVIKRNLNLIKENRNKKEHIN